MKHRNRRTANFKDHRLMSRFDQSYWRETPVSRSPLHDFPSARVIPYDYVAKLKLTGEPGRLIQDVINISLEGIFYAVSISYGFDEERTESFDLISGIGSDRISEKPLTLKEVTLDHIPADVLIEGFRLNPAFERTLKNGAQLNEDFPIQLASQVFQRLRPPANFSFLLSLVDTGTGRELQNEPVHSQATLGRADGKRPFKMLPQPMVFMPRSTIRLQVEELMEGIKGDLYITLQGYKILDQDGRAEQEVRSMTRFDPLKKIPVYDHETGNYRTLNETIAHDIPTSHVVPFDYVSTLELKGLFGETREDEIPINIDGGYVATALGYSLEVRDSAVLLNVEAALVPGTDWVDLKKIKLVDLAPVEALFEGIRILPAWVKFAFMAGGRLTTVIRDMVSDRERNESRLFQRLNRPEEVRFLYSMNDSATGRDLQNKPILNTAGLGIATGDRPFKVLHKPMMFLPRSSIQLKVQEIFGRGRLHIVFQGYKIIN